MDRFEKWAYALLGAIAVLYVIAMVVGMVAAFPFGLIGLVVMAGVGILLIKVIRERLGNREDDYYNDTVDR